MLKVFLDTNILVRFLVLDHPSALDCTRLIEAIEKRTVIACTSAIVFLETYFVLTKTYAVPTAIVKEKIEQLLHIKSLTIIEKTNFLQAFTLHKKTGVKLADCIIATQLPLKAYLATFDREFDKLITVAKTPSELLEEMKNS